ncbi:MAG TPA: type II toxin-antitoxin system antitoxin SocA domain-containing protein [Jatrophihabitans sp.]|nr:type II toxin-antitoxin system antitoxin SocA domain-containing protein [Jatrophihabitans sp.]
MTSHSAHEVAAEIRRRLPGVGVKKLHKLLYYCQGHHVASFDQVLFTETISAWDMGPVIGELWKREKQGAAQDMPPAERLDEAELNTIGYVLSRYGNLSGLDLERLTHSEAPWIEADAKRQRLSRSSYRISVESLRHFFQQEADPGRDEAEDSSTLPIDPAQLQAWFANARKGPSTAQPVQDSPESLLARLG